MDDFAAPSRWSARSSGCARSGSRAGLLLPLYSDSAWYDGTNTATCAPPTGDRAAHRTRCPPRTASAASTPTAPPRPPRRPADRATCRPSSRAGAAWSPAPRACGPSTPASTRSGCIPRRRAGCATGWRSALPVGPAVRRPPSACWPSTRSRELPCYEPAARPRSGAGRARGGARPSRRCSRWAAAVRDAARRRTGCGRPGWPRSTAGAAAAVGVARWSAPAASATSPLRSLVARRCWRGWSRRLFGLAGWLLRLPVAARRWSSASAATCSRCARGYFPVVAHAARTRVLRRPA